MTDLEIFQSLRPQVEPLSVGDRAAMRHDLFGSDASFTTGHVSSVESAAVHDDLVVRSGPPPQATDHRMLLSVAAILVAVIGVAGVWLAADRPETAGPPLAQPPSSTTTDSSPVAQLLQAPVWYDTIRPLLPDGFDQIVLTDASPEVVGFKAFRTGTRQLLDVTVTLQPGEGVKDTGEAVTFSDDHGDYVESMSAVALTTLDERLVVVRCGLSPLGGGAVGSVSSADAVRDYCGDGFDNLDVDPLSRRALAARLADEFPAAAVTPAFGQPDTSPVVSAVTEIVSDFVGETREFGTVQADGVLRVANLSPHLGEPSITELTVIGGTWPPHGDGSAFDDRFANSPHGRFYQYGDVAVALVVVDGTGYHIATTDVRQEHLTQLGELLERVIDETADNALTSPAVDEQTDPGNSIATIPEVSTTTVLTSVSDELAEALRPDGRILVVNAATTAGLAGSLSQTLADSGYDVLAPINAPDGAIVDESIMYTRADMSNLMTPNAIMSAVPISRGESLSGQPPPAVTQEMVDSADIIIVIGTDLTNAPWQESDTPLFNPGIGRLLIIDATTSDRGHQALNDRARNLRAAGIDVAGVVTAAASVEETMLMPIGQSTPWTFAVAELAAVGGFDTWTPSLVTEPIPDGVTAALVISNNT